MCGISGYIHCDGKPVNSSSNILKMLKLQKHRGPDDSGIRAFSLLNGLSLELPTDDVVTITDEMEGILGFNRLSILDLSVQGHQPMVSPDQKVLLVQNGEIYNAFEFKEELIQWGFRFKSTSDTEVVLALYLKYGIDGLVEKLNGMFAIVIIDLNKHTLYIARDRFGIKPMYYMLTEKFFAFSSELKCFKYLDSFKFELEQDQIDEYLLFRNNLKGTLLKEIQQLTPGHYLVYNSGKASIYRYFDINSYVRSPKKTEKLDFYCGNLERWLNTSVKQQLMSDVKLGCQLSGGIDSSLVTLLANGNGNKGSLESVSIIFENNKYSEENYIDHVTSKLGITGHKFLLESDYYLENIKKVTWHLEAPINHPNTVGIYKLSQKAKEFVTVLLSGEGADEIFGGYSRFYSLRFPFHINRIAHEMADSFKDTTKLINYLSEEYRAVMATAYTLPGNAKKLRDKFKTANVIENRASLYRSLTGTLFDRQIKYELISYLPDLLLRQDKMSMAHSIENRVPFLDNEVVASSFTIPEEYLLLRNSPEGRNTEKYLLKKMAAEHFGYNFAFRNKMGFGIPLRDFLLNKKFTDFLNDELLPGIKKRQIFNYKSIHKWITDINNISVSDLEALWVVLSFEIWASIYLDNKI